jgi:adenylate cyclase
MVRDVMRWLGALPSRRVTWGLVAVFSIWALLDVFAFKLSGGLAKSSYDAMVRSRFYAASPDPRIVIIDIDEVTLARMAPEFGRWPWPRDTLATVLTYLERQQPAAVVWDVLFSDADRLSPGGDAALNAAAQLSTRSHFSVVRLPAALDSASQITRTSLPGLWLPGQTLARPGDTTSVTGATVITAASATATVALIAPALPALAAGHLGFNNGHVDSDGVLRRYRYLEPLADGSAIQSIALSAVRTVNTTINIANYLYRTWENGLFDSKNDLVIWRGRANAYRRVPFADVFLQAEGGKPLAPVPDFAGKVIIIGSTAPSLHDIHPTPLSPTMPGVDTLATVLDNGLNQRQLREMPPGAQAGLAIALCISLTLWVQFKSAASLAPALFALPAALLGISYLSLNGPPLFLDLHVAAGVALAFLTVLRVWCALRRKYWCTVPPNAAQPPETLALWPWERQGAWLEAPLDRLIDAVERHAPACRVVVSDARVAWPGTLRWPELARFCAIVGPHEAVLAAQTSLRPACQRLAIRTGAPQKLIAGSDRATLANAVLNAWAALQNSATSGLVLAQHPTRTPERSAP